MTAAKPTRTLEETIAWEVARLGQHRPQGDWAAGPDVNDCALFQSAALGHTRVVWNTEAFKTLAGGTYHRGAAGLRRGDVVLFDWNSNGLSDHVEMATGSPNASGIFQTIGANSSARPDHGVAYNQRSGYVLGYWRPAYPAPASTTPAAPAAPAHPAIRQEDDIMQYNVQDKTTNHKGAIVKITVDKDGIHARQLSKQERTAEVGWAAAAAAATTDPTAKAIIQAQVAVAQLEPADFKTLAGVK
jgi:hypothetical protein